MLKWSYRMVFTRQYRQSNKMLPYVILAIIVFGVLLASKQGRDFLEMAIVLITISGLLFLFLSLAIGDAFFENDIMKFLIVAFFSFLGIVGVFTALSSLVKSLIKIIFSGNDNAKNKISSRKTKGREGMEVWSEDKSASYTVERTEKRSPDLEEIKPPAKIEIPEAVNDESKGIEIPAQVTIKQPEEFVLPAEQKSQVLEEKTAVPDRTADNSEIEALVDKAEEENKVQFSGPGKVADYSEFKISSDKARKNKKKKFIGWKEAVTYFKNKKNANIVPDFYVVLGLIIVISVLLLALLARIILALIK